MTVNGFVRGWQSTDSGRCFTEHHGYLDERVRTHIMVHNKKLSVTSEFQDTGLILLHKVRHFRFGKLDPFFRLLT
jgi:hypothetical protein